jgi:adenine-specific DNA-methyltransferase
MGDLFHPTTVPEVVCAGKMASRIKNPYVRFHKLEKPPIREQLTTLWDYPSQHYGKGEQGSSRYRGATPSWVIWNVLAKYTREGDLVVDPFCGSGTTLDVCRDLRRKGRGFDVAPAREDIERADARSLPLDDGAARCLFMDPPYADNLTYSDDPDCIGKLRGDDGSWHEAMEQTLREAARVVRKDGVVAVFVADVQKQKGPFSALGVDLAALGRAATLVLFDHVAVIRRSKSLEEGNRRKAASEGGFMMRGFSHLLLFRSRGGRR